MGKLIRPEGVSIANWRLAPFNHWSFQHVRELVPTARIRTSGEHKPLAASAIGVDFSVKDAKGGLVSLQDFLTASETNGLVVLSAGKPVLHWSSPKSDPDEPHLLFSVSKSITGLLAGILSEKGLLECDRHVTDYLPELAGSAYGDECTVRHLLDMTVSLDFEENYLDPESAFGRYRRAMLWNPVDMRGDLLNLLSFAQTLPRLHRPHGGFFLRFPDKRCTRCGRSTRRRQALCRPPIRAHLDKNRGLNGSLHHRRPRRKPTLSRRHLRNDHRSSYPRRNGS